MVLSGGRKSFQIGLAVLIQYRHVMDSHPASQTRCHSKYRAYCVAQVKTDQYTEKPIPTWNTDTDPSKYPHVYRLPLKILNTGSFLRHDVTQTLNLDGKVRSNFTLMHNPISVAILQWGIVGVNSTIISFWLSCT